MGVYISGLEMPTGNDVLIIGIDSEGKVYSVFRDNDIAGDVGLCDTGIGAAAVLVPSHGDLIDRKAAYDSLLNSMVMTGYQSRALDCISGFYVPTVIPAEEGE